MFLSGISPLDGLHELDFRFEVFPEAEGFFFAHHGATLNELMKVCGLASLGSTFYIVDMAYPLRLPEVVGNERLFQDHYGIEPAAVYGRYLRLDSAALARFFENTAADADLDCTMIGTDAAECSAQDLERCFEGLVRGPDRRLRAGFRCGLGTHDNHFLWLITQPLSLLRRLIASSLAGFFHHIHPHPYAPVPDNLIDLILSKYHIAPLVCFPTEWDSKKGKEIAVGVQVDGDRIQALIETAESSWIAHQLNPPKELLGRGLWIAYHFRRGSWSFEEWR